jgi:hypothetical protein
MTIANMTVGVSELKKKKKKKTATSQVIIFEIE